MKKYAPDKPDARLHRPKDASYLLELLNAANLSQRAAGPLLGMNERTMRRKISEDGLAYPEQYCLEVLADENIGANSMNAVRESAVRYEALPPTQTVWHNKESRAITAGDVGKMIVGRDRFGAPIHGTIGRDGFGLMIKSADGIDVHNVPLDRVALYTLIDPPSV